MIAIIIVVVILIIFFIFYDAKIESTIRHGGRIEKNMYVDHDYEQCIGVDATIVSGAMCVTKDLSVYEKCKKEIINGLTFVVVEPDMIIYKAYNGFVTEQNHDEYLANHPDAISWVSNLTVAFNYAQTWWGSVVAYTCKTKVYLLDWFDATNMQFILDSFDLADSANLLNLADSANLGNSVDQMKHFIKVSTGFGMTFEEQRPFTKYGLDYPTPKLPPYVINSCVETSESQFRPAFVEDGDKFDAILMRYLVKLKLPVAIAGVAKSGKIISRAWKLGVYQHEELVIFSKHLTYNTSDKYCWLNWPGVKKIDNGWEIMSPDGKDIALHIPRDGIICDIIYFGSARVSQNRNFMMYKWLMKRNKKNLESNTNGVNEVDGMDGMDEVNEKSNASVVNKKSKEINRNILSYNVSGVTQMTIPEFNIAILQGVGPGIANIMKGYTHKFYVANGNKTELQLWSHCDLHPIAIETMLPPNQFNGVKRPESNQILFKYGSRTIVAVHLEEGDALFNVVMNDEKKMNKFVETNNNLRIGQMEKILVHKPDIIIGDFCLDRDYGALGIGVGIKEFLITRGYKWLNNNCAEKGNGVNNVKSSILDVYYSARLPSVIEIVE